MTRLRPARVQRVVLKDTQGSATNLIGDKICRFGDEDKIEDLVSQKKSSKTSYHEANTVFIRMEEERENQAINPENCLVTKKVNKVIANKF